MVLFLWGVEVVKKDVIVIFFGFFISKDIEVEIVFYIEIILLFLLD